MQPLKTCANQGRIFIPTLLALPNLLSPFAVKPSEKVHLDLVVTTSPAVFSNFKRSFGRLLGSYTWLGLQRHDLQ